MVIIFILACLAVFVNKVGGCPSKRDVHLHLPTYDYDTNSHFTLQRNLFFTLAHADDYSFL